MNDTPSSAQLTRNAMVTEFIFFVATGYKLMNAFTQKILIIWQHTERGLHRDDLLYAYKHRTKWKKSDILRLLDLDVNKMARKRIEKLQALAKCGRPIVRVSRPLIETISTYAPLFRQETNSSARIRLLKTTIWWPYFVEALYRGEYEIAREEHQKSPSDSAERAAGRTLGVSPELIRKLSGEVRSKRKFGTALPDTPPITAEDFKVWAETGSLPRTETDNR